MRTQPVATINTVAKKIVGRSDSALTKKSIRDSLVSVAGLIGRPVRDESGRDIGQLVDIVVRHDDATYPPVSGLMSRLGNALLISRARRSRFSTIMKFESLH